MPLLKSPLILRLQALLGGPVVGGATSVDTDNISLTMPVIPELARRSIVAGPVEGWYTSIFENVHSAADGEVSTIDPYEPGGAAVAPYPASVPRDQDVWLLKAYALRSVGTGGLTAGYLMMNPSPFQQGWGIDDQAAAVVDTPPVVLARWDVIEATVGAEEPALTEQGECMVDIGIRIGRGATLRFDTESAAAAEFQCVMLMGLFPSTLGQDVAT